MTHRAVVLELTLEADVLLLFSALADNLRHVYALGVGGFVDGGEGGIVVISGPWVLRVDEGIEVLDVSPLRACLHLVLTILYSLADTVDLRTNQTLMNQLLAALRP